MISVDVRTAYEKVSTLRRTLRAIVKRNPEQEVQGIALPVIDAVLTAGKDHLRGDPVVRTIRDVVSPEAIAQGQPLRAVDALVPVEQLREALQQIIPPFPRDPSVPGWLRA